MKKISMVVATDRSGIIGCDGQLPWNIPIDRRRFKNLTMGHPVIMGRKTFESIDPRFRPLPGRTNIVLSQTMTDVEKVVVARDISQALQMAESAPGNEEIFVIGGHSVYRDFLPFTNRIYWTLVGMDCHLDTERTYVRFPTSLLSSGWKMGKFEMPDSGSADRPAIAFFTFDR
ncbi:MAG: hypothetical protein A2370_01255 [Candidatus Vogelbacteria bacterium RIFOXYB1_FULL_42_16]|uniref:dihydrofolate reductase n=1 Tax=Candidatus Vogelbacteria bacterium RIFOXYB1_FULL_42_16 TaxID=1802436 RepID=A0A1G2QDJ9_9BACT|nr:MAG: hypothetical protein A2370_01255 [Candidatus Vogelbacteria bacterium RIFOXYB1_FULL_42_16]